ncbi:hypothetical protein FIBSPDRAFT_897918 [Athelia psychrophila]|uniref:Uncharacterized protein n=1 Tax=Athelia psychrophila TaxID=1759441 RepID=A0A166BMD9_9AGAM|nr:hypothetical protein FIBSPDRAFT_897918 [Fibularhizoctonia sp. CBS 109695]
MRIRKKPARVQVSPGSTSTLYLGLGLAAYTQSGKQGEAQGRRRREWLQAQLFDIAINYNQLNTSNGGVSVLGLIESSQWHLVALRTPADTACADTGQLFLLNCLPRLGSSKLRSSRRRVAGWHASQGGTRFGQPQHIANMYIVVTIRVAASDAQKRGAALK